MPNDNPLSLSEITKIIISEFIDSPELLVIEEKTGNSSVIIGISSIEKDDIAQIIGRNGSMITAIKKVLERIAHKRGLRCTVYVVD
jgi:predicted RNA-binding protein YlqC (UPF0109 family)